MTRFFERNKRKSVLATLLLLFGRRRDLGLLLLMVFVLLFVFVLPSNFSTLVGQRLARVPGGSLIAAALGVSKPSFGDLLAAFRAARNERAPWEIFLRGAGAVPASSIDMVRGNRSDLAGGDLASTLGSNATIRGILNRDDAARTQQGVYLDDKDVGGDRAGLVQSALGGGFGALGAIGAFAARGFFGGGLRAAAPDGFSAALGTTQVPGTSAVGVGSGRLSKAGAARNPLAWTPLAQNVGRGMAGTAAGGGACLSGGRCAFAQLTNGRSNAMLASSPVCSPGNGCPPEYAASQTGIVYDNNQISAAPQVLTSGSAAPQLDGINGGIPNPPSQGNADSYTQQANQLQNDEQACNQADATYGPQEQALQDKIQSLSNDMNNLNCGGGGCSAPGQCQSDGTQMKQTCTQLDGVMYQHYQDCPIEQQSGPYQHQNCS